MTDREKTTWWMVLNGLWFMLLLMLSVSAIFNVYPDGGAATLRGFGIAAGVTTVAYLLVLTWRLAYLAGRNKR